MCLIRSDPTIAAAPLFDNSLFNRLMPPDAMAILRLEAVRCTLCMVMHNVHNDHAPKIAASRFASRVCRRKCGRGELFALCTHNADATLAINSNHFPHFPLGSAGNGPAIGAKVSAADTCANLAQKPHCPEIKKGKSRRFGRAKLRRWPKTSPSLLLYRAGL